MAQGRCRRRGLRQRQARAERGSLGLLSEISVGRVGEREHHFLRRNRTAAVAAAEAPERCWFAVGALEGYGDPPRQREPLAGAPGCARNARIVDDKTGAAFAQRCPRGRSRLGWWDGFTQPRGQRGIAGDLGGSAAQDATADDVHARDVGQGLDR